MRAIGFITEKSKIQLIPEDQMIARHLRDLGITVYPVAWDDFESSMINKLEFLVFRTPWNYHLHTEQFLDWLKHLESFKIPVFNSISTVRWNLDKHYLQELANKGAPILPTVYFDPSKYDVNMEWPHSPNGNYVIKPVVSASASRTFRGDRVFLTDVITEEKIFKPGDIFMAQPFAETILSEGEYSFLFFKSEFSHAIQKRHKNNDFRVQEEHGGTWDYINPSREMVERAQKVLTAHGQNLLYARVDMVNFEGELRLMELEVFEPMLYINREDLALRAAKAIASCLSQ